MDSICYQQQNLVTKIDSNLFVKEINLQTKSIVSAIVETNKHHNLFSFISNDTLFTIIITISIFALGLLINWQVRKWETKRNRNIIKRFIKKHLDAIIDNDFKEIALEFEKYSESIEPSITIPSTPPKIETTNIERLRTISSKEIYSSLEEKSESLNIQIDIDFLYKIFEESKKTHLIFSEKKDNLSEKQLICLNNYTDSLVNFSNSVNLISDTEKDLQKRVEETLKTLFTDLPKQISMNKFNAETIEPFNELIFTDFYLRKNLDIKRILDSGQDLKRVFNLIEAFAVETKDKYKDFADDINKYLTHLESEIAKINWR